MGIAISTLFLSHLSPSKLRGRAVVITGCDTGFGHDLTLKLLKRNMRVYAGCLTAEGCKELQSKFSENANLYGGGGKLITSILDVAKDDSVAEFVRSVKSLEPDGIL
jgi:NAD(P)-dependent dehydrogenase (short-subunit alcohol dehydrogenase family)